jgi:hypothetical protein
VGVVPDQFYEKPCKLRRIELFVRAFIAGRGGKTHVASECLRFVWAYKLFGNGDITMHCLRSGDAKLGNIELGRPAEACIYFPRKH